MEETVKALKFKLTRDMAMHRKLTTIRFTTSQQGQQEISMLEQAKTSDALLIEFGFDSPHLAELCRKYELENNEEVTSFRNLIEAQKKSEEQQQYARALPPKEKLEEMMKEAKSLGEVQVKADGTMTFDFFLNSSKIVFKYTLMQCAAGLKEMAARRREAIKNNDDTKFQEMILETSNWE